MHEKKKKRKKLLSPFKIKSSLMSQNNLYTYNMLRFYIILFLCLKRRISGNDETIRTVSFSSDFNFVLKFIIR